MMYFVQPLSTQWFAFLPQGTQRNHKGHGEMQNCRTPGELLCRYANFSVCTFVLN